MTYVKKPSSFNPFDLKKYYNVIYKALDQIYPAFVDHDLPRARKICSYEKDLDGLFKASFTEIRDHLRDGHKVDDMLTLLNIIRYLERVGDSFQNIGEAIMNVHVGEKMGLKQFRVLQKGLATQNIDIEQARVEFQPIMNTRSGSRVARITDRRGGGKKTRRVFYKEGTPDKIDEEVAGLKLWQQRYPDTTAELLWHNSSKSSATILMEHIEGADLLEILINKRSKADKALKLVSRSLRNRWDTTKKNKTVPINYINQLMQRKEDIQSMHDGLFKWDPEMKSMLREARTLEKTLKAPFSTLIHGDMNVDNMICTPDFKQLYYVDVHRSTYGDYVQDVSVFLASNFRIPLFSNDVRRNLNAANDRIYTCARSFARKHGDVNFDARLALGLFRSFITSTRFLIDTSFSRDLYYQATEIMRELLAQKSMKKFKLRRSCFTYG
ncbi:MAG: PhoU domain-containing protein [Pseudomonadota bacterium]